MSMGGWVPLADGAVPDHAGVGHPRHARRRAGAARRDDGARHVSRPGRRTRTSRARRASGSSARRPPACRHLVGQRVVGVCIQPWGSLADVGVAVGTSIVARHRSSIDEVEAAAFLIPAHTGYHAVVPARAGRAPARRCWCRAPRVGSGSACVQLAAARGAHGRRRRRQRREGRALPGSGRRAATVDHSAVDVVEGVRARHRRAGRRRRRSTRCRARRRRGGPVAARSRRPPRAVRPRRRPGADRPALLRRQRHARGRDARRLPARHDARDVRRGRARPAGDARRGDVPPDADRGRRLRRRPCRAHRDGRAPHDRPPGRAHRRSDPHTPPRLFGVFATARSKKPTVAGWSVRRRS